MAIEVTTSDPGQSQDVNALSVGYVPPEESAAVGPEPEEAKPEGEAINLEKAKEPEEKSEEKAETKEDEKPAEKAEEPEPEKPAKRQPGYQKRIDELTRKRHEAERKAMELERELEAIKKKAATPAPNEPKPEDFENEKDYLRAVAKFEAKQTVQAEREAEEKARREAEVKAEIIERKERQDTMITQGQMKYRDFTEVVMDESLPLNESIVSVALESDKPHEVIYHLAKNPDLLEKISKMKPVRIAAEIGKIELKLQEANSKKPSKAPAPITPLRGGETSGSKDPEKMSLAEYAKWRKENRG